MSILSRKTAVVAGTLGCALGLRLAGSHVASAPAAVTPVASPTVASMPLWAGADPWVTRHDGAYYGCESAHDRIYVWRSNHPTERGERQAIWAAPREGWNRAQVWAPEMHFVRGRWYVYYAASSGRNANHRMGVLESATSDPFGPWVDRGVLYTGDDPALRRDNRWAIDGTILERGGALYFVWSGWADERDVQWLYAAPMSDPATISGPRVRLCPNDTYAWERVGDDRRQRGLHEGPAFLRHGGRTFLVYSCSGSWQTTYKLGMLWADDAADPLNPASWHKVERPVFESTRDIFGVGHCSFTSTGDGQDWIAYHAKAQRRDGWARVVRMQPFCWTADGFPDFGAPGNPRPAQTFATAVPVRKAG
jgi:GH43 family beta-xylosidase